MPGRDVEMKNLITCLAVCMLSGAAIADTWTVDDDGKADFDNIQAAVDAASDGDEVPNDMDNCYLFNPDQADCNGNGVGDVCDIEDGRRLAAP